jgi:hypothetical protein
MLLMLCIASCSLNKDFQLNDTKADNNYAKHLAHSGKFGRCSLCNHLALASQSTDSAVMPLAEQPEEQEQIFASNATQDNIILKPSKFNFEESFENFENSSSIGEKEIKKRVYKNEASFNSLNPAVKPGNAEKKSIFLGIALAAIISSIFFLEVIGLLIALIAIPLVMLLYNYKGIPKAVKNKKSKWARLGFFMSLLCLIPPLFIFSPFGLIASILGDLETEKNTTDKQLSIIGIVLNGVLTFVLLIVIASIIIV